MSTARPEILSKGCPFHGTNRIAFGPDGTLYWADFAGGYVGKRTVDGAVSTLGTVGMGVDAICVSPDGRVFSGQCFAGRSGCRRAARRASG